MKQKNLIPLTLATAVVASLLAACSNEDTPAPSADSPVAIEASALLMENPPAKVPGIHQAFQQASPGETFFASGRIGGMMEPISENFAGFVLTDERVWFCDEAEDDPCPTPWDACCEDPAKLADSRFFIQFSDTDGQPLPFNLRETLNLAENQQVVIKGRIPEDSSQTQRMVQAEALKILP